MRKCDTCHDGQWEVKEPICFECINGNLWSPRKKVEEDSSVRRYYNLAPKDPYIGHREGG